MLLKGKLDRKPLVKMVSHHMYLGILIDEKLSFKQHLIETASKTTAIFYKIRIEAKVSWGLGNRALSILYKGVKEAILLYGAPVWARRMTLVTYANILLKAQRVTLLTVCKAFRTLIRRGATSVVRNPAN